MFRAVGTLLFLAAAANAVPVDLRGLPGDGRDSRDSRDARDSKDGGNPVVVGGTQLTMDWSSPLPGNEAELLLSLDGGSTFPLRVAREESPENRNLSFRVPNLPSDTAVLALRTGEGGEDEAIRALSAPFSIEADPAAPVETLVPLAGELATRDAALDEVPLSARLRSAPPSLSALGGLLDAVEGPGLLPQASATEPLGTVLSSPLEPAARPGGFRPRISLPKRE